jgi:ataxin-10
MFLPRINFGRPVAVTRRSTDASTPSSPPPGQEQSPDTSDADNHGFAYLKRDLVRLLGILCHEKKAVQDRVRGAGGIEVVMSMCVIDDRNPCKSVCTEPCFLWEQSCTDKLQIDLREHAIFTLRNLLKDNQENQSVVYSIQPWDENDLLKDNQENQSMVY